MFLEAEATVVDFRADLKNTFTFTTDQTATSKGPLTVTSPHSTTEDQETKKSFLPC